MILKSGLLEVEFFPHPGLDPYQSAFSACIRVGDIDQLRRDWGALGLPEDNRAIPVPGNIDNAVPLRLGVRGDGWGYLNGMLDELVLWNRALTAEEVASFFAHAPDHPALERKR